MELFPTDRVKWLARLLVLWALVIVLRLIWLQFIDHAYYAGLAQQQHERVVPIPAPRGTILDRNGQKLAISRPCPYVSVDSRRITDLGVASTILANILQLDRGELLGKLSLASARGNGYVVLKPSITPEEVERLQNLKFDWIDIRLGTQRVYSFETLAAHVLGGVDADGKGNGGVEQSLDEDLQGHPGELKELIDVQRRSYKSEIASQPEPGKTVRLTILNDLQWVAENSLRKAVLAHHCKSGTLVVMNPKTGEILAIASYPSYDPNVRPRTEEEKNDRADLAVQAPFEPGSVFKVVTITAALETTRIRPQTVVSCGNGSITLFGRTIHDHSSYASLPMEDVLARSSNIGAINIGLQVGDKNMYEYMRRFGLGKPTGIQLPGESGGVVRRLKLWQKSSIGSVAMGHEVSVTALQLARIAAAIANGGYLVKPRLLLDAPSEPGVQIIHAATANSMRVMMRGVVDKPYGTGYHYARIPGYSCAGKTGTAQIYDQKAHVYTHLYNASFMGFAPANDPAVVTVVTVNGAGGTVGYGGPAAGPVFREVTATALRLLGIPKDLPDSPLPEKGDGKADANDLAIADLCGTGIPACVPAGTESEEETQKETQAGMPVLPLQAIAGPKAPDFTGMTKREIVQRAGALDLPVEFAGAGLGRSQYPPPGSVLPVGWKVRVQLGR